MQRSIKDKRARQDLTLTHARLRNRLKETEKKLSAVHLENEVLLRKVARLQHELFMLETQSYPQSSDFTSSEVVK